MIPDSAPIGHVNFTDGSNRHVYFDRDGSQYVLGDDDEPVYGTWIYIDEPIIVERSLQETT